PPPSRRGGCAPSRRDRVRAPSARSRRDTTRPEPAPTRRPARSWSWPLLRFESARRIKRGEGDGHRAAGGPLPEVAAQPLVLDGEFGIAAVLVAEAVAQRPQPAVVGVRHPRQALPLGAALGFRHRAGEDHDGRPGAGAEHRLQVDHQGTGLLAGRPRAVAGVPRLLLLEPQAPLVPDLFRRPLELLHGGTSPATRTPGSPGRRRGWRRARRGSWRRCRRARRAARSPSSWPRPRPAPRRPSP